MPILANNNFSLKIYCENIVVAFLNFDFLFLYFIFPFSLYFFSSIRLFFLFFSFFLSCFFSSAHIYLLLSLCSLLSLVFLFFYLTPEHPALYLLLSLSSLLFLFFYGGSVWIEISFAETENWNWKHCSKIIFKYMYSTVGFILIFFNFERCVNSIYTVHKQ